jgi:hypothetical protein
MENVLAVNFDEGSNAYEALSVLKEMDGQGQLELGGAARNRSRGDRDRGIVGLVIGILGG